MAKAEIDMNDIGRSVTLAVTVKNAREYAIRLKIALILIRLAAWVAHMGLEVKHDRNS